ncbi:phospho-N-acetylmuramoyl-pentapeptide-transferase [Phocea massiliensis]|uniref:Phospho-N-acetylmuramoyl-pentapeptide-transferase n=1 Tax=Merdimmobilis hominis TaxID=2897707 RepID=A0A938X8W5_9FIRM|nr:phospho-N-acetylmuramoyl-pentapeptide-transferase [Merdimmobilis hominis]MBM6921381.1 phospho-N-acetylmuramoyl-pentapeptide-transferase [Merdimmobilis hominis]
MSFSIILTAVVAFGITVLCGILLIPVLRRLKFGQSILEEGPSWHKSKQGTPTMGGIMFIAGIAVAVIAGYFLLLADNYAFKGTLELMQLFGGLVMALLFGLVGFLDDYIKVVKKRNLGLTAWQKIVGQVLVTALYLAALYAAGDRSTIINVPFLGQWDLGLFYYPVLGILIIGIVNSVNLTDGIDGLCSSVTFVAAIFFMIVSAFTGQAGMSILSTALAAGCVGFLVFNAHPAKVFMGDTGSLFLGGMVVALGFGMNMEFILFFAGFVYCCESLSVILQVISFKTTGKRIFKMSPIHHHFEMSGFSENKIVLLFSAVTFVMCVIGFFAFV